jgi:hypothetical protein
LAFGPGVEEIISYDPTTYTIQAYNSNGEKIHHGGEPFDAEVAGPDGAPIKPKVCIKSSCSCNNTNFSKQVIDNKDGSYTVSYTPGEPGKHTIESILRSANPLYYDHIKNSPVTLQAKSTTPSLA